MPTPPFISSGWSTFNDAPNGLAEGNGYIYVAEGDGASISIVQLLNAGNNASVTQWTGYSGINFLYPTGVAVNPTTGSVYVLNQGLEQSGTTNGSAVYEFGNSPAPAGVTTWTGYGGTAFNFPSGIAVDSTGNVYVTDQDNFELEEFSSGGTTLAEWNDNNNSYFYPAAVAVDSSNNLYVVDAGNYVVWKLSSISGTVSSWPILPSSSYDTPFYGVGVDSSGNVFVADYTNNLVEVYSGGNLIGEMTGESGTPFSEPDAVLLYNNDIYVANYENSAGIQIFGPNNY
jgi:sugar lactone lactonase YvrE